MLSGCFSFAIMGTLTHALNTSIDWRIIALSRTCMAFLLTGLGAVVVGARLVLWGPRTLWTRSLAGSVSLVCTFFAFTRLPVSDVLTLTNLFPIWVAILSWPLLKEPPSGQVWLSVVISVAGMVLIQQPHFAEGNFVSVIALVSSFFTAIAMIGLHRIEGVDAPAIVVHFSGVSILFCFAALLFFDQETALPFTAEGWPLVMLLGVGISATIGQLFLTKAFAAGPPARISVVGLSQIVFAMAFEVVFLHRSFNPSTLLGIALVIASTAWLMVRRMR
jgi:drug/metabolite transporter (DMT)-like permease